MSPPLLPTWLVLSALVAPCLLYDLAERYDLVGWWRRRRARRAAERQILDAAFWLRLEVRGHGHPRRQSDAIFEVCDAVDSLDRAGEER